MFLTITDQKKRREIPLDSIEYLSSARNYTLVYVLGQKPVLISKTLGVVAKQLPEFVRIHKQTLINPAFVTSYQLRKYRVSTVTLSGNRVFVVSRRRVTLVYDRLGKL